MDENDEKVLGGIKFIKKTKTHYSIKYDTGEEAKLNILNDHVFRFYMSPNGEYLDYPEPLNPDDDAKIVAKDIKEYGYEAHLKSQFDDIQSYSIIKTKDIQIVFDKIKGTIKIHDTRSDKDVIIEAEPITYSSQCIQTLYQKNDEYFFGGGMQNGKFSHKGELIHIANTNDWTDGGVTSPCPFYWSSYGYGVLRNTWQPGQYDFGETSEDYIRTIHEGEDFDAYFFINTSPRDILQDYYELTGKPILLPEYAYYQVHLNAFNRDYWVEVTADTCGAILFEDKKYYKAYQPQDLGNKEGTLESLNGEKNNYQFSARAMIDRYRKHDIPLAWFIPNDGYNSGYGQTDSLDGDIHNLKQFVDYAKENGVNVALWTESNLEPVDPLKPTKGDRDLRKEVGICNVVALKCDVKWIGCGYSLGLCAIKNAANIFMNETKHNIRPVIITVDGWAGTQRFAGIWSGDQEGGNWEYIRFHIPTYIGAGLSGIPVVGSDMDGIYGGEDKNVNIRDYQWKTFTPLQLNMDGWGTTQKTPFAFDEETTEINRAYLKLKSMLMPYNYTIGHESLNGLPMIRAMYLHYPNEVSANTEDSQYQYMWGPNILVAPIYNDTCFKEQSIRDGIYLPDNNQVWIDFLTGKKYQGGKIYNGIVTPLWKLPVFIKDGSIIPMTNPNNNPDKIERDKRILTLYPNGESTFEVYEDDGITLGYLKGQLAITNILIKGPNTNAVGNLVIKIHKTTGSYFNMVRERSTLLKIMASSNIVSISAIVNGEAIQISKSDNLQEFKDKDYTYYFEEKDLINPYFSRYKNELQQTFLLIKIGKLDITSNEIILKIKGFVNSDNIFGKIESISKTLQSPSQFEAENEKTSSSTVALKWKPIDNADYYEIERDGVIFTNITDNTFSFQGYKCNTEHNFRIRSVFRKCSSEWSHNLKIVTKSDPYAHLIFGVKVTCNLPCQTSQEVCQLTDGNLKSLWHTDWGVKGQASPNDEKFLKLFCDLGQIYELDKVSYLPRDDAGNGTFLELQYRYSTDNKEWCPMSNSLVFAHDNTAKTIEINGRVRFIEFTLTSSVGNFGSGRQMLFFKK